MYHESAGDEPFYKLNAKGCLSEFKSPTNMIAYRKEYLIENTEELDAIQAKIDKEVAMLEAYINSGEYEAHVEKYRQEIIDAVRLRKPMMQNEDYTAMVKDKIEEGTITRVVIASSEWWVEKDEVGYPKYKYLPVDIAITDADGRCWLAYGQIRRSYQGWNSYGSAYFNYWGKQEEMNCDNVNR